MILFKYLKKSILICLALCSIFVGVPFVFSVSANNSNNNANIASNNMARVRAYESLFFPFPACARR